MRQLAQQRRPPWVMLTLAFAAVYFFWGSTYLAIHVAIESIPPFLMIGLRFSVAGLLMYVWLRWRGKPTPSLRHWGSAIVGGLLLLGIGNSSVAWSEQYIPTGLAALLVSTVPIWMVLLDWLWLRAKRPGLQTFFGLVLGGVGIVLLVDPATLGEAAGYHVGAILVSLMGALAWATGSIYVRKAELPSDPFMSTAMQMIGGGVGVLVFSGVMGEWGRFEPSAVTLSSVFGWGYLVVFGSFVGLSAYVWLLKQVSPAKVATHAYVNPVVAVALGWLILGEAIDGQMIFAIAVLLSAVVLLTMPRLPKRIAWRRLPSTVMHNLVALFSKRPFRSPWSREVL